MQGYEGERERGGEEGEIGKESGTEPYFLKCPTGNGKRKTHIIYSCYIKYQV